MKRFITLFVLAAALYATPAHAAILANWEFDGVDPGAAKLPVTPTEYGSGTQDANMQTAILGVSNQVDARSSTGCYKAINWEGDGSIADFAEAISNGQYFTIQFAAQAGYQFSLTSLDLLIYQTGFTTGSLSSADVAIYSSIGGFTAGNELYTDSVAVNGSTAMNIDLTGGTFDNLTSIEFRIYAKGADGNSDGLYFGILNGSDGVNDIALNGTISAVPEPSTYALIALGAIALMSTAAYRRRTATTA